MRFFGRNIVLRLFMTVCALAQVAAVMPHHHHEASDAMCINPLHCLESHSHTAGGNDRPHECGSQGHIHDTASVSGDAGEAYLCGGHLCLHNTSGHRHTPDGSDCSFNHLDLNPPAKDKVLIAAPIVELAYVYVNTFPPLEHEGYCRDHCRGGEIMCCSVFGGTLTLHCSYCATALPARAPSVLA